MIVTGESLWEQILSRLYKYYYFMIVLPLFHSIEDFYLVLSLLNLSTVFIETFLWIIFNVSISLVCIIIGLDLLH